MRLSEENRKKIEEAIVKKELSKISKIQEYNEKQNNYKQKRLEKQSQNLYANKTFGLILYPENDMHMRIKEYISYNKIIFPHSIYILHDKDYRIIPEEASKEYQEQTNKNNNMLIEAEFKTEHEKPHYHMMFELQSKKSAKSALNLFDGLINHVEPIADVSYYLSYMIHQNLRSLNDPMKYKYNISDIKGDIEYYKNKFIQNTNSVQSLNKIIVLIESNNITNIRQLINTINCLSPPEKDEYYDIVKSNFYIISNLAREFTPEVSHKYKKSYIYDEYDDIDFDIYDKIQYEEF